MPASVVRLASSPSYWRTPRAGESLGTLLGRTRAEVLCTVATHGYSTTQVAHHAGVSMATASQHLSVLWKNGLVVTHWLGSLSYHIATPLGRGLCGG
ncbi:winged helix-turn-helix domain-containing protein [Nocardiopsis sp. NPDC006198]|uniref:ArsR/SmtB family transcription factor n=1 Tax=Nocardiopsis sp. NPDC006198 TaxID=3154472 RepID=UPI0033B0EFC0